MSFKTFPTFKIGKEIENDFVVARKLQEHNKNYYFNKIQKLFQFQKVS
jgi:hypothetical protein